MLSRVRGNRGELVAVPLTSRPERLLALRRVVLFADAASLRNAEFEVESVRNHDGQWIFKFRGIDTISAAEGLRNTEVRVPFSERLQLDADEFYESDLVGCEVIDRSSGDSLGRVTGWGYTGGPPLLEVQGKLLVPFARSICVSIDTGAGRIEVELPEGLKELNEP